MANYATVTGRARSRAGRRTLTSQQAFIPGRESEQVRNAAGGVSFKMDDFDRLQRFLILGVEGNTYYQSQKVLAGQNLDCLDRCLKADGRRVVDMAVDASFRSFKLDACVFVLAAAAAAKDEAVRQYALANLPRVARTLSILYKFAEYVSSLRGWGRGLRRAFANWLTETPLDKLAYQSWKFKGRDGWTAQDIMRKVHPVTDDMARAEVFTYMAKPRKQRDWNPLLVRGPVDGMNETFYKKDGGVRKAYPALAQIEAAETLLHIEGNTSRDVARAVKLITDHRLTHEAVPTNLRKSPEVWEALLESMPMTAAVRNLGAMTANGLLTPMSASQKKVVNLLGNAEAIERSRTHPVQFLIAAKQYSVGRGLRGSLSWKPNQKVLDALDGAFYASFGNVPVTGGNILVAVDVSGSMSGTWSGSVMGIEGWTPIMAAGAMALVTLKTEPNSHLIGFDTKSYEAKFTGNRIDNVVRTLASFRGGATDTAVPVQYAKKNRLDVDAIVSYTDNETWAGYRSGHVVQNVEQLTDQLGHTFQFLNCGMTATGTSDVDPKNRHMFELVGMDANTPRIISEFVQGNL